MHLEQFYLLPKNISGKKCFFLQDESHHIHHVLRKKTGDIITACDGRGTSYQIEITTFINGQIHGKILESRRLLREPVAEITVASSVIKPERFDWLVEKSTEIGVKKIIPVYTDFGVQSISEAKIDRWKRIAISALKQSGRSLLPDISEPKTFQQILSLISNYDTRYILHPRQEHADQLKIDQPKKPVKSKILILTGPESGFSDSELANALEFGFRPLSLGSRRLRSETAAVVALTIILYLYGDLE